MLTQLTDETALELIASKQKVIVMFYANWCGSCRLFKPKFEKISNKAGYEPIQFISLNAEECPTIRKQTKVNALPFFATFANGEMVDSYATLRDEHICKMASALLEI